MAEVERFAPTVVIDRKTVTPESWMWILAYAMAGVPWAIETAISEEYDLRGRMLDYERRKKKYHLGNMIEYHEKSLKN